MMDKELARYIRDVACSHSATEMIENDLFLSSLLTDLVYGVSPQTGSRGSSESPGMARLRAMHELDSLVLAGEIP